MYARIKYRAEGKYYFVRCIDEVRHMNALMNFVPI